MRLLLGLSLITVLTTPALAGPRIVNGEYTFEHPATGAVLAGGDPASARSYCSGTLIGCDTVLTAAHCVCDQAGPQCQALDPGNRVFFLQHGGFAGVTRIAVHPDYEFPVADVAVLTLARPMTGIAPVAINTAPPILGAPGVIVGFGRSGGGNQDYGLKRTASVVTASCLPEVSDTTSVCWRFSGAGGNTCNGDSGGPLFADFGAGVALAGVTSGGTSDDCLPDDTSYDANVQQYAAWIAAQGGLGTASCGAERAVGEPGTDVLGIVAQVSALEPSQVHAVSVAVGTPALRIALNGVDDGSDFDLYVKQGAPPTLADHDCAQNGSGQHAFCSFAAPAPGPWYALVQRYRGQGAYQLTATTFGVTPAACGNGLREGAESCDGGDDLACPGACAAGCVCAPPCNTADLAITRLRVGRSLSVRGTLDGSGGGYAGLDPPRAPLTVVLDDGTSQARAVIPAGDPGWSQSNPERGSYRWRSATRTGLRRVSLKDRTARSGTWQVKVTGTDVPGAATLNPSLARVTIVVDGRCLAAGP